jgi:hypothetical protein
MHSPKIAKRDRVLPSPCSHARLELSLVILRRKIGVIIPVMADAAHLRFALLPFLRSGDYAQRWNNGG